jgi:hypothetical protein
MTEENASETVCTAYDGVRVPTEGTPYYLLVACRVLSVVSPVIPPAWLVLSYFFTDSNHDWSQPPPLANVLLSYFLLCWPISILLWVTLRLIARSLMRRGDIPTRNSYSGFGGGLLGLSVFLLFCFVALGLSDLTRGIS